jgi:hypothetical protein
MSEYVFPRLAASFSLKLLPEHFEFQKVVELQPSLAVVNWLIMCSGHTDHVQWPH